MCTAIISIDRTDAWPILAAFIRDEDRARPTDPPGAWWPPQPSVLGGRDRRAGGTWLAVDVALPGTSFLLNHFDPHASHGSVEQPISRGSLPLEAIRRHATFDPNRLEIERFEPFQLVQLTREIQRAWRWDGATIEPIQLEDGISVIASRVPTLDGESARRATLRDRFMQLPRPTPTTEAATSREAWGAWIDALDGRHVRPQQLDELVVHSIDQIPGFGTVGASLVALAADGRVRYDISRARDVAADSWSQIASTAANVSRR